MRFGFYYPGITLSNHSVSVLTIAGLLLTMLSATLSAQPAAGPAQRTLQLGLKQAVDLALAPEGNARIQLAEELIYQAQARSAQSRAALLPNLDASITEQNRTLNLSAIGIQIPVPIPGFRLPRRVGPFDTFDARAAVSQSIFDLSAIRRFQAARVGISAAEAERESARDQVAALVAKSYLWALRTDVEVAAGRANVDLAETLLKLALDQKETGTGVGVEVTRARVQLANERQRLLVAENDRKQAYMELLRAMGLALDVPLELTDKLLYTPMEAITVDQALAIAMATRADLKAQQQRAAGAQLSYRATKLERLPSVAGFADYGSIGSGIDNAIPTRTYGFSVRLPLFDGGRRDARRAENRSQFRQENIKTNDLRQQIDLEIRLALNGLSSAEDQVKVAQEGLELAQTELAQARRRYQAGVASSVEVTDAQTRLARARDNQIAALFNYNLARINLGQAMGAIRSMIK